MTTFTKPKVARRNTTKKEFDIITETFYSNFDKPKAEILRLMDTATSGVLAGFTLGNYYNVLEKYLATGAKPKEEVSKYFKSIMKIARKKYIQANAPQEEVNEEPLEEELVVNKDLVQLTKPMNDCMVAMTEALNKVLLHANETRFSYTFNRVSSN